MNQLEPLDWTVNETLDYLAELYPQGRKTALDALRRAAREGRVRVSGYPCKWDGFLATETGARESIPDLAWADFTFEVRDRDWAAVWQQGGHYRRPSRIRELPPAIARLLVDNPSRRSENSQAASGWCHLRVYRGEVLSAFRKPLTPDAAANLARFADMVARPRSGPGASGKQGSSSFVQETVPPQTIDGEPRGSAHPSGPSDKREGEVEPALPPKRGAYRGELADVFAKKTAIYWSKTTDHEAEQQFRYHCQQKGITLPERRYIIKQIAQTRARASAVSLAQKPEATQKDT